MRNEPFTKNDYIVLLLDIISILVSYVFAASLRKGILKAGFLFSSVYGSALVMIVISYTIIYEYHKTNRENICKRGLYGEFVIVLKNHLSIGVVLVLYLFMTKQSDHYSRLFFVIFLVVDFILDYLIRGYFKVFALMGYKKSQASSKVMLVTLSERAEKAIKRIKGELEWATLVNAIIILDKDMSDQTILGVPILKANKTNLIEEVKHLVVDEVFFHLPFEMQLDLQDIIIELERMGIKVHVSIDSYLDFHIKDKKIGDYLGYPVITFSTQLFDEKQILLKRIIDIIGGMFGCFLFLIILFFVAPAIKLESKGPVFFTQKRVGKNGRIFIIYKFRSMYADAEARKNELLAKNEMSGFMFKMENDPRITKVGKFLRKTSLDEFPQFLNVLKGDMSLVGTRPPTVDEYVQYETLHRRRISIKPGITGLWQVSGRSDITDFEEIVKLDLQYIDNWSIWLDFKILFKTVVVVAFSTGAV